ncbi:MAG: DUF1631 family protein [Luteimonas sp.]
MQGIPRRSREVVSQLLAQLPDLLGQDLEVLMQRLEEVLATSRVSVFDQPACCRDSQRILLYRRRDATQALVEILGERCEAMMASPNSQQASSLVPGRLQGLRLLENEVADEEAAIAALSRRHASRASLPLLLLGQRFGVLYATPAMSTDVLPVGPHVFCQALGDAVERIGVCVHVRLALYKLYDVECMDHYPRFAEAVDAALNDAGVLHGLAYVPARKGSSPIANSIAKASEQDALQAVNKAAEALSPGAALPQRARNERQEAIFALAKYLMRHGRDSGAWNECIGVADTMVEAADGDVEAPEEATGWLRRAINSVGYGETDSGRLVAGLTARPEPRDVVEAGGKEVGDGDLPETLAADTSSDEAPNNAPLRGLREQRCFDRLLLLPTGATLGFSTGDGGFLHVRLTEHRSDPASMLLETIEDVREIVFEADMLARLVASGQAWVVRQVASVAEVTS